MAGGDVACKANDELDEVYESLESPDVFELSEADLEQLFAQRREAIRTLVDVAETDAEAEQLEKIDRAYAVVEPAYVEALTEYGDEVEAFGYSWTFSVFTSGQVSSGQSEAYFTTRDDGWPLLKVAAMCSRPELLGLPEPDLTGEVEAGTIVFDRLDGEDTGLWAVPSAGGEPVAIAPPEGWDDLDEPAVGPDGRTIVAVALRGGDSPAVGLATGTLAEGFTVRWETSESQIYCPRIGPDGTLLATVLGYGAEPNRLLTIDASGESTSVTPAPTFYCAEMLSSGEVLLGAAAEDRREYGDLVRVADDGSLDVLYGQEDCNGVPTGLSPDQQLELVVQTCFDPDASGLVVVDIADGSAERIVDWTSAVASWSPTGEWITFGIAPADRPLSEGVSVWVVRPDGSGLRRMVDEPSSWPAWVADELPGPST